MINIALRKHIIISEQLWFLLYLFMLLLFESFMFDKYDFKPLLFTNKQNFGKVKRNLKSGYSRILITMFMFYVFRSLKFLFTSKTPTILKNM